MSTSSMAAAFAAAAPVRTREEMFQALKSLKELKSFKLISEKEYEVRRQQIVDSLTGTTIDKPVGVVPASSSIEPPVAAVAAAAGPVSGSGSAEGKKMKIPAVPACYFPADYEHSPAADVESDGGEKKSVVHKTPTASASVSVLPEEADSELVDFAVDEPGSAVASKVDSTPLVAKKKTLCDKDDPWLNARPPPDFSEFPVEKAVKYVMDDESEDWVKTVVRVKVDSSWFAKGSLRNAFHLLELTDESDENSGVYCVAKFSRDPFEDEESYFKDVRTQWFSQKFAEQYNSYNPPKPMQFIKAWVLRLVDRPSKPLCGVEAYIAGPYRKHNNNFGYVSEEERSTPQAFSHFTYHASEHKILICDIQGVNDLYTDPQIHSNDGTEFSKGNMGQSGFTKFLSTHRCNAICRYLKLPSINAKDDTEGATMPSTRYMSYKSVEYVVVENSFPQRPTTKLLESDKGEKLYPMVGLPPRKVVHPSIFHCCVIL